ncbi:MAG: hypothetical protein LUQ43_12990 [Methanoregula sp.]|nr:hypothetical protein [Methanoregula sp.]MDD1687870.1 hypothetical protein [Methanoregula sp.]
MTGGSTVVPNGSSNINVLFSPADQLSGYYAAPLGTGPGVNGTEGIDITRTLSAPGQQFGNYTLMQGTTLSAKPAGAKDAASLGSSGQSNVFGGYGASNASYEYWVPEVTTPDTPVCWGWNGETYDSWASPTCADYYAANWVTDFEGSGCTGQGTGPDGGATCYYVTTRAGTTTPGYYATAAETKGKKYLYTNCGDSCIDPAKTVLGTTWYNLNWGDTVNVKVIHIPTGKVIFHQDVPVTEE